MYRMALNMFKFHTNIQLALYQLNNIRREKVVGYCDNISLLNKTNTGKTQQTVNMN